MIVQAIRQHLTTAVLCLFLLMPGLARAQGFPGTFADVVERVLPTVVVVQVETPPDRAMVDLDEFFGGEAPGGSGSGFFIDTQGHLATNEHVVSIGEEVSVVLHDGKVRPAEVLGVDVDTDLAVLKIDPTGLEIQAVEWADSDKLRLGDWVLAVGNPLNVGITVTHGIVSALDRDLSPTNPFSQRIQTDAAINFGNSGGPSFDINGKVIGVNQSIVSRSGGSVGLGFMIPANVAVQVLDQLRAFGEVRRGFLGITFREMTQALRLRLGSPETGGVFVEQVLEDLPAERAGIRPGDILLTFQGREIRQQSDFIQMVASTPPGALVVIELFREGQIIEVEVELTLRVIDNLAENDFASEEQVLRDVYGVMAGQITLFERLDLGLGPDAGGVRLFAVAPRGPFAAAGARADDIVQQVNGKSAFNLVDLLSALEGGAEAGASTVELTVLRDGKTLKLQMKLP